MARHHGGGTELNSRPAQADGIEREFPDRNREQSQPKHPQPSTRLKPPHGKPAQQQRVQPGKSAVARERGVAHQQTCAQASSAEEHQPTEAALA